LKFIFKLYKLKTIEAVLGILSRINDGISL